MERNKLISFLASVNRNTNECISRAHHPALKNPEYLAAAPVPRPLPSAVSWRGITEHIQVGGLCTHEKSSSDIQLLGFCHRNVLIIVTYPHWNPIGYGSSDLFNVNKCLKMQNKTLSARC